MSKKDPIGTDEQALNRLPGVLRRSAQAVAEQLRIAGEVLEKNEAESRLLAQILGLEQAIHALEVLLVFAGGADRTELLKPGIKG